ncbi:uncharacterized protein IAS62_000055 [Cryptococcus decagattii]|uniref:Uncharacterized protein n=1 Tax=Cryptococcus decagattii TaxID=1859122 RepID=A0ABZ2ANQ2_9TREE
MQALVSFMMSLAISKPAFRLRCNGFWISHFQNPGLLLSKIEQVEEESGGVEHYAKNFPSRQPPQLARSVQEVLAKKPRDPFWSDALFETKDAAWAYDRTCQLGIKALQMRDRCLEEFRDAKHMDVSGVRQNFSFFGGIPILRHDADLVRSLYRATRYGLTCGLREIAAPQRDHAVQSSAILAAHHNFAAGTYNGDDSAQGYSPDSDPPHFKDHEPLEDPTRLVANPYYTHHFTTAYDPLILTDIAINICDAQPVYIFHTLIPTFKHFFVEILQFKSLTAALHTYLRINTHLPGDALEQLQKNSDASGRGFHRAGDDVRERVTTLCRNCPKTSTDRFQLTAQVHFVLSMAPKSIMSM